MVSKLLPPISNVFASLINMKMENIINENEKVIQKKDRRHKSKFSIEEDNKLASLVEKYGTDNWSKISDEMENRNPRQCRERWNNYVNPALQNDKWTYEEDCLLVSKYAIYGSHWNKVSKFFQNKSDNAVRNRWHTLLRRSEKKILNPFGINIEQFKCNNKL